MSSYYPPTGFHFKVEFQGVAGMNQDIEQRFQDVNGLSFSIETESLKEGGENRFEYKLPQRVKYSNLILKRGLLTNAVLLDWIKSVASFEFNPANIIITLLNEADQPVALWHVIQAYPVKWSVSDFKATESSIVVETIELAYQYFECKLYDHANTN